MTNDKALITYITDDTFLIENFLLRPSFGKYLQLNNVSEIPSMLILNLPAKESKYPLLGYIQKKDLKKTIKKLTIVADEFLTIEELKNRLHDSPFLYNLFLGTLFLKKHKNKIILGGIIGVSCASVYMLIKHRKILLCNSKIIIKNFRELMYPKISEVVTDKISKTVTDLTFSDSLEVIDTPIRVLNRLTLEDMEKRLGILYQQRIIAFVTDYVHILAKIIRVRKRRKLLMNDFEHLDQLLFLSQLHFPSSFFEDMDITKLTPMQILLHFKDIRSIFLNYAKNLRIIRELDKLDELEKNLYKNYDKKL